MHLGYFRASLLPYMLQWFWVGMVISKFRMYQQDGCHQATRAYE